MLWQIVFNNPLIMSLSFVDQVATSYNGGIRSQTGLSAGHVGIRVVEARLDRTRLNCRIRNIMILEKTGKTSYKIVWDRISSRNLIKFLIRWHILLCIIVNLMSCSRICVTLQCFEYVILIVL